MIPTQAGGTFYSGTVTQYDETGFHVTYDDGDSRMYADINAKTWRLAD